MALGELIYSQLIGKPSIKSKVQTIVPEFRDNKVPSIVYELGTTEVSRCFEHSTETDEELSLSVVTRRYRDSVELADILISELDHTEFENDNFSVLGCFYKSKSESYIEVGDNDDRLAVVDLRFELTVVRK